LAVGSRSGGWDLMQARGRVDRYPAGLTGGVAWARPLDADPTIQKLCMRAAAASSRRRGEARRRAAALTRSGTGGFQSLRDLHCDDERARANPLEVFTGGGEAGRRRPARHGGGTPPATVKTTARRTSTQTKCTGAFLTKLRSSGTAPIDPDGGETAASGRKPSDGAFELGLWAAAAQGC
jgi:hypothetical protein